MKKHFKTSINQEGISKIVDSSNSDLKYIEMGFLQLSNKESVVTTDIHGFEAVKLLYTEMKSYRRKL